MIIGSEALIRQFGNIGREPKDLDVVYSDEKDKKRLITLYKNNEKKVEYLHNPILVEWIRKNHMTIPNICPGNELLTLKVSHSFWDLDNNSWNKHLWDINFLKDRGFIFIPELFYQLFEFWEKVHGKRRSSNLDMSAAEFFDNAIDFPVGHDNLHEILIKHPYFDGQEKPTYTKILKEEAEVDVCMDKFNNLTEKEKFNVVFEEVSVMSMENRYPEKMYWKEKYNRMLKKFIISHCKIEEGIWIIMNHKKLLTKIPFNYQLFINNILENEFKTN